MIVYLVFIKGDNSIKTCLIKTTVVIYVFTNFGKLKRSAWCTKFMTWKRYREAQYYHENFPNI